MTILVITRPLHVLKLVKHQLASSPQLVGATAARPIRAYCRVR